ncbi:MAG: hypothetical protein FWH32_06815 [Clostridiales bacterium]|nr:hypothetical protein [Clostridiales bacterium]
MSENNDRMMGARKIDGNTLRAKLIVSETDFNFFVEGRTDEQFYKSAGISSAYGESVAFFYAQDNKKSKGSDAERYLLGQEAVIDACRRYSAQKLKSPTKKNAFIIDYDFDSLSLNEIENLKGVTTTKPVHSIEGFFLLDENILKIFEHVENAELLLEKFKNVCEEVLNDLVEFYALRSTITYAINREHLKSRVNRYKKIFPKDGDKEKDEEKIIFAFNFKEGGLSFERSPCKQEVDNMHSVIDKHKTLFEQYEQRKRRFTRIYQLKGKTVFRLLDKFLKHHKCKVRLMDQGEFNPKIVELLTVDIKPKFI